MSTPPKRFSKFIQDHPEVGEAYNKLGEATASAGPLDPKTTSLVKLGVSIGMRHEGAVHAHTRKALERGCTPDELRHAAILATTTMGFPNMMAAYTWVEDVLAS
jgi:AhpD family alkylhydroperoxidase